MDRHYARPPNNPALPWHAARSPRPLPNIAHNLPPNPASNLLDLPNHPNIHPHRLPLSAHEFQLACHYNLTTVNRRAILTPLATWYIRHALLLLRRPLTSVTGSGLFRTSEALARSVVDVEHMSEERVDALTLGDTRTAFRMLVCRVMLAQEQNLQARRAAGVIGDAQMAELPFHMVATDQQVLRAMRLSQAFVRTPYGGFLGVTTAAETEEVRRELELTLMAIRLLRERLTSESREEQEAEERRRRMEMLSRPGPDAEGFTPRRNWARREGSSTVGFSGLDLRALNISRPVPGAVPMAPRGMEPRRSEGAMQEQMLTIEQLEQRVRAADAADAERLAQRHAGTLGRSLHLRGRNGVVTDAMHASRMDQMALMGMPGGLVLRNEGPMNAPVRRPEPVWVLAERGRGGGRGRGRGARGGVPRAMGPEL